MKNKLLPIQKQLNNKMKTLSNNFKLDNWNEIWQRSIYRKGKRHGMNHAFKTKSLCIYIKQQNRATCKLFLQKKIERTQNEHEF